MGAPALSGSVEELFHQVEQKEFMLFFGTAARAAEPCARRGWNARSA
jgi:hypothetical protein